MPRKGALLTWQERFRKIRELAEKQEAGEHERLMMERKRIREQRKERQRQVKELAPTARKVCVEFARGVDGKIEKHRPKEWGKENFGWNIQRKFGGVRVRVWPWVRDPEKPLAVRGIWLQFLDPEGSWMISEKLAQGTRLEPKENPGGSGYYYWQANGYVDTCAVGYFLALDGFSEEKLARSLEKVAHDLLRFNWDEPSKVSADAEV
jgi:hypothetical protein